LQVCDLADAGHDTAQIARLTGIPYSTVRNWLKPRYQPRYTGPRCVLCRYPPHDFDALPAPAYSYLLGIYLGDGTVARMPRTLALRVYMDSRYPNIIGEVAAAMRAVMPTSLATVHPRRTHNLVIIRSYSKAWQCLIPQIGPGRKCDRKIDLADWQQAIVEREPEQFIRGLIHSDGCRTTNRVTIKGKRYEYPRYFFTQVSRDIQELFCRSLRQLGVEYRFSRRGKDVTIHRRASVARLDTFVGPKS